MSETVEVFDEYRVKAEKLAKMSRVQVRQLMGNQPPEDPRVAYIADIQCYTSLANVQLASMLRVMKDILKVDPLVFMEIQNEELDKQIAEIEKDLCITSWTDNGGNVEPIFDLDAYRQRTEGWPE